MPFPRISLWLWFALVAQAEVPLTSLRLLKDARLSGNTLQLTPARKNQTGAAWLKRPMPVAFGFESRFRFRLSDFADNIYGGADGLAFVIQSMGTDAIAGRGAAGGFSLGRGANNPARKGIPRSLAIFIDTFKNEEEQETSGNSIGLFTNGDGVFPPRRLVLNAEPEIRFKDGATHEVKILYQPPLLQVFLDRNTEPALETSIDIVSITGNSGGAYVGFTAATGEGFQVHEILDWHFEVASAQVSSLIRFETDNCLPGRTLCTPPAAEVHQMDANRYLVTLPAHLEWGASVEHAGQFKVSKLEGTVCWDRLAKACNGPDGAADRGNSKLLRTTLQPGSLLSERRGSKVFFSVNGIPGSFTNNEGYFRFEVAFIPSQ